MPAKPPGASPTPARCESHCSEVHPLAAPATAKADDITFPNPAPQASKPPTQIPLMLIDGLRVDKCHINFAGSVEINLENAGDRALFNELLLGRSVKLTVEAYVATTAGKAPRDKEGVVRSVNKPVSLRIHTVHNDDYEVLEKP